MSIILVIVVIFGVYILIPLLSDAIDVIIESIGTEEFLPKSLSFLSIFWTIYYFIDIL
jgi:hypothetical protein